MAKSKTLWVHAHPVGVKYLTPLIVNDEEVRGAYCAETNEIEINSKYPLSVQMDTLWHEAGHAIRFLTGKRIQGLTKDETEDNAIAVAEEYLPVLRDPRNRWFKKLMVEDI